MKHMRWHFYMHIHAAAFVLCGLCTQLAKINEKRGFYLSDLKLLSHFENFSSNLRNQKKLQKHIYQSFVVESNFEVLKVHNHSVTSDQFLLNFFCMLLNNVVFIHTAQYYNTN